ncbi:Hypothetical protein AA314_01213 [Archangium gephyra]|uniref:Uncharacterized protein n=1 Tax=Archangium gephyra TaxID=48 RepID=A0AAC8Q2H1_9BACT|nr:Hypothetical protein AA314_01213 [Archangium gephyra]
MRGRSAVGSRHGGPGRCREKDAHPSTSLDGSRHRAKEITPPWPPAPRARERLRE